MKDTLRFLDEEFAAIDPDTPEISGPDEPLIWADAICINQDAPEKNVQVPLMTDIYSKAALVVTYMGPEEEDSRAGFELLAKLARFYAIRRKGSFTMLHNYDLEYLELPSSDHPSWHAIRKIFRRPWSSRAWIVQEFVANLSIVLVCGGFRMEEWVLYQIVDLALEGSLPEECIFSYTERDLEGKFASQGSGVDRIHTLGSLRSYYLTEKGFNQSLWQLLRTCHQWDCGDPRDKVFAFLNLATDCDALNICPDYSDSTTVKDLYTTTAVRILENDTTIDLFSSIAVSKRIPLPSWAPDWSYCPAEIALPLIRHAESPSEGLYCASADLASEVSFDESYAQLTTKGSIIDQLAVVSDNYIPLVAGFFSPQWDEKMRPLLAQEFQTIWTAVICAGNQIYGDQGGFMNAFWRTLITNVTHEDKEATSEYELHSDAYTMELEHMDQPSDARTRRMACEFAKAIELAFSGTSIGVTKRGYICRVPEGVHANDTVAVLRGGCVPFVLRPEGDGILKILGEAYVHGLMKGEALQFSDLSDEIRLV